MDHAPPHNRPVTVSREGRDWAVRTQLWLPRPRSEVFEFFADAHNLEELTPTLLRFHVVTPRPIDMHAGTLIDYRLRIRGVPITWKTEIQAWEPGVRFVDNQLKGPYVKWWHEHTFEDLDGGTLCGDLVLYRPPGGPFAPIVNWMAVERDVRAIFEFRTKKLLERFGTPSEASDAA
ncbi:MAG: SRPBCC family protein [Planctomycetota bacterium]